MRAVLFTTLLFFALGATAQQSATLNLMPVPGQMQLNSGKFRITNKFTLMVKAEATDTVIYKAVNRAYQTLNRKTGLIFGQKYITNADTLTSASLMISVSTKANAFLGA